MNQPPQFGNRRIRVFVSSTFRDMVEERDELMAQTWPELRRFCRERQVELVEVDLRWGITEEQSTRKETLKLCLDEIRSCRPFFIGLLGERYGWTPSADAFTADLTEEQPWLRDLHGKSVTELEILHGVLNNPDMAARSFFYFRDPAYARTRGSDFLSENADAVGKQAALKETIRRTCAAKKIPLRENYSDPRQLAAFVLEDLKAAIEAQFPKADVPDPLSREARDHEAFAEIRRRTYIGRDDYLQTLDRHAASLPLDHRSRFNSVTVRAGQVEEADDKPLALLGESGSGKSALLANWLEHWRTAHPDDFIVQHYIGGTPDSADHWRVMTRIISEIKRWSNDPDDIPRSHEDLLRDFPVWLRKARNKAVRDGVRFILVLDALNQLENRDHARMLGWLPVDAFAGPLRLIVSTLVGDTLDALKPAGWGSLRVEPLTADERRKMIAHYLGRFSKKLEPRRLERLAEAPAAGNPLYLKILLDELRVTGAQERLDERLNDYLSAPDVPALLKKVLARYRRDYERDRPGLVGEALGLIWAARQGLTETELLRLLKPANLPQLPLALWSPLRAALEDGLVDRGGVLNFGHDFLRAAVAAAFVPDENHRDELRLRLADDFEKQPSSIRGCEELPWLLWQAKQHDRLRACLLDIDRFLLIQERDQDELLDYWVWLQEERTMGAKYRVAFVQWIEASDTQSKSGSAIEDDLFNLQPLHWTSAAHNLAMFLIHASLYDDAEILSQLAITIDEGNMTWAVQGRRGRDLSGLARSLFAQGRFDEAEPLSREALAIEEANLGPDHHHVATELNNLATVLIKTGRDAEAEPLLRRALAIHEKNYGPNASQVAIVLNNLVPLLQSSNGLIEAETLARRALAIDEQNYGGDNPKVAIRLTTLARILHSTERLSESEPLYRRALAIDEKRLGADHPEVATDLNNLATLFFDTSRFDEAEHLMRRSLAIEEQSHGLGHSTVATTLNNLAQLLRATNRMAEAEPLAKRAVEIFLAFTRSMGHPHPDLNAYVNNYAKLLAAMGFDAEQILVKVRAMDPELFANARVNPSESS